MDKYQERYLEHIENKLKREQKKTNYKVETIKAVYDVIENRKSVRRFKKAELGDSIYTVMQQALETAPSSCNRKGIYLKEVSPEYAEEVLVGGKGWISGADKVFFLFGAKECYKNPKEVGFMPYLDAGFVGQNIYLLCEIYGIGCCFVNPNLKMPINDTDYFVGAVALGEYE
jgi:nitroreductase